MAVERGGIHRGECEIMGEDGTPLLPPAVPAKKAPDGGVLDKILAVAPGLELRR